MYRDLKVLVVDDNKMDRTVARAILNKLGIGDVTEAESSLVAQGKLHTAEQLGQSFELILLDWNMPRASGLHVLKTVRSDPAYRKCKVIIMTATSEEQIVKEAIQNGVDEFVVKPLILKVLAEKIEKVLAK